MSEPDKGGRPTKFNPELGRRIVTLARLGHFRTTICDALGIARRTFYDWAKRSEADNCDATEPALYEWGLALRAAEAEAEMDGVLEVRTAIDPKRVAGTVFWLERRWPQKYGRRLKAAECGPDDVLDGRPNDHETQELERAKLRAEIALLEKKASGELPEVLVVSPGDAAFDDLMRAKWGAPRQGTPAALPATTGRDDGSKPEG